MLGVVSLLLIGERSLEPGGAFVAQAAITVGSDEDQQQAGGQPGATEVYPLTIFALGGMLLFVAANDLLTMFVALEVFSLPLYLLCALARRRRLLSQEAALKYFLLGSYASAFFLFGVALIYGFAGAVDLGVDPRRRSPTRPRSEVLLFAGLALVAIGLLFKAAAAPFHVWTPDVYQGAPTPITALHGGLHQGRRVRRPAAGALRRPSTGVAWDFQPVLGVDRGADHAGRRGAGGHPDRHQAAAGLLVDRQRRLPAGRGARAEPGRACRSTMFYLVAYGFSVLAAFGIVTLVRDADGEATHLSRWAGLGRKSPLFAGGLHLHPAGLRRHPADQRLHRASSRSSARRSTAGRPGW